MTTGKSPLRVLKAQADNMAKNIKAIERGDLVVSDPEGVNMRAKDAAMFGIVMDDRVVKLEIPWAKVKDTSEVALAAYILKQMRDEQETQH